MIVIKGKQVDITTAVFEGVDSMDYPDFSDAFISEAMFDTGVRLTEDELELLNDEKTFVYHILMKRIF